MLCRIASVSICSMMAVVVAIQLHGRSAVCPPRAADAEGCVVLAVDPQKQAELLEDITDQARQCRPFAQFSKRLTEALLNGSISLREATEQLFCYSLQGYPMFLEYIWGAGEGRHVKTKVAHRLMRWVRESEDAPGCGEVLARLEQELRDLPYEEEASRAVTQ
jgi:hypothetical protein